MQGRTFSMVRARLVNLNVSFLCASTLLFVAGEGKAVDSKPVERGRYLVSIAGCNDCHTPFKMGPNGPEPDMSKLLSGHPADAALPPPPAPAGPWLWFGAATGTAFAGPWGVTYAINLTPDMETGLGIWTEAMFLEAFKTGKHMGKGRPIMPPMPIQAYQNMTEDDVKAIFAYLQTVPPIKNTVPQYQPAKQ